MAGPLLEFTGLDNSVFIETGTFKGATIQCAVTHTPFSIIHSIELDYQLYLKAVSMFVAYPEIHLYHGSSLDLLPLIIDRSQPTTIWLDAHKTIDGHRVVGDFIPGCECPLLNEIDLILLEPWTAPLIIVVDDARMFTEQWWTGGGKYAEHFDRRQYPTTKEIFSRLIKAGLKITEKEDRIIANFNPFIIRS